MFLDHVEQYPESYALGYPCDDRNRHENVGELLRKETTKYDRRVRNGWIPGTTDESSFLDPSSPWDHILWKLVHGQEEKDWWMTHFTRKAMEIRSGISTLASAVVGDAPVAGSGTSNVRAGNRANRPPVTKPLVMPNGHTTPPARPESKLAPAVPEGPRFFCGKKHGKFEICRLYNRGQCNGQIRVGACGNFTCPNVDRVHACNKCGGIGHPATECKQNPLGQGNKQKLAAAKQAGQNNGKGGKGGNRGKSDRKG